MKAVLLILFEWPGTYSGVRSNEVDKLSLSFLLHSDKAVLFCTTPRTNHHFCSIKCSLNRTWFILTGLFFLGQQKKISLGQGAYYEVIIPS